MKTNFFCKLAIAPVILFTLQSCFTAKNYVRPEVVDEAYYRTDQLPADSLTIAEVSWKELFTTDAYLPRYIEEGLENNIDIRVALQQIDAAETYYRQGKASYYPDVNASGQVNHQRSAENTPSGTAGNRDVTLYELAAGLSWEADIWGKIRSNARASEAVYLQTAAAHQAIKTELIANIASVYFQLLAYDKQLRITEESIVNRKTSLETTKSLKDAGYVTEAGVKQTEAQLYTAQALKIDLETNIKLLENTMSILLGDAPRDIERGQLHQQDVPADLHIGFPVQLLRNRPDVMEAEYNLVHAFELTNAARSNFYPSLNISVSGGLQSLELADLLSLNSLFSATVGSVTQPVFNGRQIRTQYEVAQSQEEQAYLNFRWAVLNAEREVSDALYSYKSAEDKIGIETMEYEAYEMATSYSEELLNNGLVNYLEVLTARESALNSQLNLIDTRFSRLNSVVELYRALGGGWQ